MSKGTSGFLLKSGDMSDAMLEDARKTAEKAIGAEETDRNRAMIVKKVMEVGGIVLCCFD